MPSNSDLKRWYKVFKVKDRDFVRYDNNFRILCFDAIDDFHAVNLGQMNEAIQKAIQSHAYDVKVKKIVFPYGELTSLTYDTEDGLSMLGTTRLTEVDDETVDIETSRSVPLRAIDGLSMDVSEDGKHIEISGKNKSNATNLENGEGTGSLVQKRLVVDGVTWTTTKAYQGAGAAFGGGTQAGRTEEEFNAYFWDSTNNVPLHNGQGKNSEGEVLDNSGLTYSKSYSFAVAEGDSTKALGRGSHSEGSATQATGNNSHAEGDHTLAEGECSHAEGLNTEANSSYSHAMGVSTVTNRYAQLAVGQFNTGKTNTIFEVGNGWDENHRYNAFEVLEDGRAKVQSAPVNDDDVVRKKELKTKISLSEFSVLTQEQVDLLF